MCGFAIAAGTTNLLIVGFDRIRNIGMNYKRTSERSIPMPKALVATMTPASRDMKRSCTALRSCQSRHQHDTQRPPLHCGAVPR